MYIVPAQLSPGQTRLGQDSTGQSRPEQARAGQPGNQATRGAPAMWAHSAGPRAVRRRLCGVKWVTSGVVAHICAVAVATAVAVALSATECTQRKECATQVWFDLMNERNF